MTQGTKQNRRALIYCRVASETPDNMSSQTLDMQEQACRAFAERRGIAIAAVVREVASGAGLPPLLQRELAAPDLAARYNMLLVMRADRLTRNLDTLVDILYRCEKLGMLIVSVDGVSLEIEMETAQ